MPTDQLTAVLLHGALSDASIWRQVVSRLQPEVPVLAPALPMRSLQSDVDHLRAFLDTIDGRTVLVGHSYGGSVISHPAFATDDVTGLVFVSAFQLGSGESTGELNGLFPGSRLGEATTLVRQGPLGADLYLRPEDFRDVYAGDLDEATAAVMAVSQRPINPEALGESFTGDPSWATTPSWVLVSTLDNSLPPEAMRYTAERAGSTTVEVPASHASPMSRPDDVSDLVRAAIRAAA